MNRLIMCTLRPEAINGSAPLEAMGSDCRSVKCETERPPLCREGLKEPENDTETGTVDREWGGDRIASHCIASHRAEPRMITIII